MARALFIGARGPLTAGALAGWLSSGNEVVEFWASAPGVTRRAFGQPRLSPAGLIARHDIPNVTVPRLSRWPGLMDAVQATGADALITCATEMIVPGTMLDHFGTRAVNLHPAMLPEYRGPTPYLPMLLDGRGDSAGGVTLHVLSRGIDEGDIIAQEPVSFSAAGRNHTRWYAGLIGATYRLMRDDLPRYLAGEIVTRPQTGGSYVKVPLPMLLTPELSDERVKQMLARAGSTHMLAIGLAGKTRPVRVSGLVRSEPRTGAAPRLRRQTVEIDFADARLTLRRATGLDRRVEQWRLARLLRPLQL